MGIGSTILAGVIYFYLSRGGDNMGGGSGLQVAISPEKASQDEIIIVGSGQSHKTHSYLVHHHRIEIVLIEEETLILARQRTIKQ